MPYSEHVGRTDLPPAAELWLRDDANVWQTALLAYPDVLAAQDVAGLVELDTWYRADLPAVVAGRMPPLLTRAELLDVVRWKMKRGEWRQRNLVLAQGNTEHAVQWATGAALAAADDRAAVEHIGSLAGVGPATASAVLGALLPRRFPFLDDLVGGAVPELGPVRFAAPYYLRYAAALRERAAALGSGWTAQDVGFALWAAAGGKRGR